MKKKMLGIVSTGIGNIGSILRMLERVGAQGKSVSSAQDFNGIDALILPGVGHFDHGMRALKDFDLDGPIREYVLERNIPILGICLGMQLLCRRSEEGTEIGLGLVNANVKKFEIKQNPSMKVPHMGWSEVRPPDDEGVPLVNGQAERYYFVHSYYVVPDDESIVIGVANYGTDFCAAFRVGGIFGVQFHPEKSHRHGIAFFQRFLAEI